MWKAAKAARNRVRENQHKVLVAKAEALNSATKIQETMAIFRSMSSLPSVGVATYRFAESLEAAGITAIVRSPTDLVFAIPRIQMDDTAEDRKAIQPALSQVVMYPLSQFDGKMKTVDWSKISSVPVPAGPPSKGVSKWVNPETYFDELIAVMKEVPPLPGEEALYEQIAAVFEAAAKDPATKTALVPPAYCEGAVSPNALRRSDYDKGIESISTGRRAREQRIELS